MKYFLMQYNRVTRTPHVEEFADAAEAYAARNAREAAREPHMEVVLLMAQSIDDLKRTHSRYFKTIEEIISGSAGRATEDLATID